MTQAWGKTRAEAYGCPVFIASGCWSTGDSSSTAGSMSILWSCVVFLLWSASCNLLITSSWYCILVEYIWTPDFRFTRQNQEDRMSSCPCLNFPQETYQLNVIACWPTDRVMLSDKLCLARKLALFLALFLQSLVHFYYFMKDFFVSMLPLSNIFQLWLKSTTELVALLSFKDALVEIWPM